MQCTINQKEGKIVAEINNHLQENKGIQGILNSRQNNITIPLSKTTKHKDGSVSFEQFYQNNGTYFKSHYWQNKNNSEISPFMRYFMAQVQ